jgi:hypothetical protein
VWTSGTGASSLELESCGGWDHRRSSGVDGRDDLGSFLVDLWSAYPGSRVSAEEIVAEHDRVALRYVWRAREGEGWPAVEGTAFMRFSGETVVECWQGVLTDAPAPDPAARPAHRAVRNGANGAAKRSAKHRQAKQRSTRTAKARRKTAT